MSNSAQSDLQVLTLLQSSAQLSVAGKDIGLFSLDDFIQELSIHPYAAAYSTLLPAPTQHTLLSQCDNNPAEYFVSMLTAQLVNAAQQVGEAPLYVRMTGADSHARQSLLGAELEAAEVNPLLGQRGVSRYADARFRHSFELECEAIKRARNDAGMKNIELVIPFARTFSEAATVIDLLAEQGLCRGAQGLKVHLQVALPANALLADKFLQYFDGLVIDIDQIAQFTLGLDLAHPALDYLHDRQNDAVIALVKQALDAAMAVDKPCRVMSQFIASSPNWQAWLQEQGITSVITYAPSNAS